MLANIAQLGGEVTMGLLASTIAANCTRVVLKDQAVSIIVTQNNSILYY